MNEEEEYIHIMIDKHIEEIFAKKEEINELNNRVICLENAIPEIKKSFDDGSARMERIENTQSEMSQGINDIKHTLTGINGVKGVVELLNDNINKVEGIKTFIDGFKGVIKTASKWTIILSIGGSGIGGLAIIVKLIIK